MATMRNQMVKKLMTKKEVAEYLGISMPTFYKLVKIGLTPNIGNYYGKKYIDKFISGNKNVSKMSSKEQ